MPVFRLSTPNDLSQFPWMEFAYQELNKGVKEWDPGHNPQIVSYLQTTTNISVKYQSKDETHWCSAFVNWCLKQVGVNGTNHALATSWLRWGEVTTVPVFGNICVLRNPNHVGFIVGHTGTNIHMLGGNQSYNSVDQVCIKSYPQIRINKLIWPSEYAHQLQSI